MTKLGFAGRDHVLRDDSHRDGVSGGIERLD